jgi:hypothetical protein
MVLDWRLLFSLTKRRLLHRPVSPNITQGHGNLIVGSTAYTFVMICGPDFDQAIPNAGTTARLGWCHGFEQIGIPYEFVSVSDLAFILPGLNHPICWISAADYAYLDQINLSALKKCHPVVWVGTWFHEETDYYRRNDLPITPVSEKLNYKVLSSEPGLVFTISPAGSFEFYNLWATHGARLVSLPLACDSVLYHPDAPFCPEFENVQIAFVGGYWSYKARQFDRYLKPYNDRLTVFGYSSWPYANYGGLLPDYKEPSLYRQACLSPTINEPHVEKMGVDLNERVFKVLGSGGMTVTDVTPAYREWFSEEELLVPKNISDYHALVQQALTDNGFNRSYREKGQQAIRERHTYAHRARLLLEYLGLSEK